MASPRDVGSRCESEYLLKYSRKDRGFHIRTSLQTATEMLKADIVKPLLVGGANVDATVKGTLRASALQAFYKVILDLNKSNNEKLKILQILITRGCNINTAPARRYGDTALQAAVRTMDLGITNLLLHNPIADANTPPYQDELKSSAALDISANYGRLDIVKLLLSCKTLSHRHGKNEYDGAISLAERQGHLAVADLIHEHTKNY